MTRDQIISALYTGKNFNECLSRMEPAHLREDLKQEVIAVVLEWPEDKIVGLWERRELDFYVARVIINHIQSNSSPFYKKYRATYSEIDHEPGECDQEAAEARADRETKEALEDLALDNINSLYWYDAEMIRLYMELGNYRAIQKKTGIPFVSCYKNIQKSISILRSSVQGPNKPIFSKEELRSII